MCIETDGPGRPKWPAVAPGPVYEAWRHRPACPNYVERSRFGLLLRFYSVQILMLSNGKIFAVPEAPDSIHPTSPPVSFISSLVVKVVNVKI